MKTLCKIKEVSHKIPHDVRFHLYERSKIGKSVEIGSTFMVF